MKKKRVFNELEEFLTENLLFLMEHYAKNENDKERACSLLYWKN